MSFEERFANVGRWLDDLVWSLKTRSGSGNRMRGMRDAVAEKMRTAKEGAGEQLERVKYMHMPETDGPTGKGWRKEPILRGVPELEGAEAGDQPGEYGRGAVPDEEPGQGVAAPRGQQHPEEGGELVHPRGVDPEEARRQEEHGLARHPVRAGRAVREGPGQRRAGPGCPGQGGCKCPAPQVCRGAV